jgi:glutamate dehydrogenase (NAD(P)+)
MKLNDIYMHEVTLYDPDTKMRAYIVVDRLVNGICGGGVRMSPSVTREEVGMLARTMTYKFAAVGVKVGGAKSGIVFDPRSPDKKDIVSAFGRMAHPYLTSIYVIGEDMGTNADDVALINKAAGVDPIAFAREKARELGFELDLPEGVEFSNLGGESFEEIITGYGIAEAAEEAVDLLGMTLAQSSVAIQGFGTVGSITARNLARRGVRVVAVADREGTIRNDDGLDVEELIGATDEVGTIVREKIKSPYTKGGSDGWLTAGADIIVPAAIAGAISRDTVKHIDAKLILEGANIPVTDDAQRVLTEKGIPIIPDFIANAGAAAGFGLILTGECAIEEVFGEFSRRIRSGVRHCIEESNRLKITTREAAIRLAEKNLEEV